MARDHIYTPNCGNLGPNIEDETIFDCIKDFQSDFYSTQKIDLINGMHGSIEDSYGYLPGTGNVLITAPHAQYSYRHECPNSNPECNYGYDATCQDNIPHNNGPCGKTVDTCTGAYAVLLHYITGAPVIWTNYKHDDPNYYHQITEETVQTPAYQLGTPPDGGFGTPFKMIMNWAGLSDMPIKLVMDLHGAGSSWPWDLDLGTGNGCSGGNQEDCSLVTDYGMTLPNKVIDIMNHWGISDVNWPAVEFSGMVSDTVSHYASQVMGIDALQFEMHRDWRQCADSADSLDKERAVKMIRALTEIIVNVNEYYTPQDDEIASPMIGDCSGDGILNVSDLVMLSNCILSNNCDDPDTMFPCSNGDVNGDGLYNILDLVGMINVVLTRSR